MEWLHDLNWFAIQAKPHQERLAAAHVARLDVEVFLPKVRQEQAVCGSPRLLSKALFCGYFFARFFPLLSYDAVRYASGVLRVVGTNHAPTPIPPEVIGSLQQRVQPDGYVRLEPAPFREGDRVSIVQGPLAGWMGRVEREWDDRKRVAILLETLQQTHVLVETRWLAAASAA